MKKQTSSSENVGDQKKRDFVVMSAAAVGCVGAGVALTPFIKSLSPDGGVLAVSSIEVDISDIKAGSMKTVTWQGKPVFIRHRTKEEISEAKNAKLSEMRDPQNDDERVAPGKEEWLVTIGICTHLGCVPLGNKGDYNGWFCPCHGSHYDTSGRVRKGPAPKNLHIPKYEFINDSTIKIGV